MTKMSCGNVLLTVIWVIIQEMLYICLLKKLVYEHNENIMNHMEVEKVVIPCHDIVVSVNISPKKD